MKWVQYQRDYLDDQSPQKAVVKSRRCGFSEVVAYERACRAAGYFLVPSQPPRRIKPVPQNFVSAGLEQSKDLLARAGFHLRCLEMGHGKKLIAREGKTEIVLTNGIRLKAFSSNPHTLRGVEGDVILDEFASLKNPEKVWAATVAIAKATLGNREGFQIVVVFTPLGDDNMAYEVARGRMRSAFSLHEVDIHRAVRDGFPITVTDPITREKVQGTIDDLREEVGDPDIFAQEFECSFLSASTRYISAEVYDEATYDVEDLPAGFHDIRATQNYGGLDLARVNDLTAWTELARHIDINWHTRTDVLRAAPFAEQRKWVEDRLVDCSRVAVDGSGMGMQFAEELVAAHTGLVESVVFSHANKEIFASGLKLALQKKRLRPRADDIELRREVLSMRREVTDAGNIRYLSPRERGSHGDRAWSLALAEYASGGAVKPIGLVPKVYTPPASAGGGRVVERGRRGAWNR